MHDCTILNAILFFSGVHQHCQLCGLDREYHVLMDGWMRDIQVPFSMHERIRMKFADRGRGEKIARVIYWLTEHSPIPFFVQCN